MSLDSQLETDFNFQVVSSNPGTRQISVVLADPENLGQQNDPEITGHVTVVPTCIKTNHLHCSEGPTLHNQKNVAIARCTSLWSSKQKYIPKRLQQRCCLHPPRCINCPVIRTHCDGVIPMPFNTNCNSNLVDGSPKILVVETSSSTHSSAGYKMTSPKPKVMPKQITSFTKQITASTLSSCFQKNTVLGSNSCCQDLSDSSEVSESTSYLPSFLQPKHAQKYLCYYPNSYNQLTNSKSQQLCQHLPQQYSILKSKPLCVENKLPKPQESHVVTYIPQSYENAKNSPSSVFSDGLQGIHKQNTEEFHNFSFGNNNNNADSIFPSGSLYPQGNANRFTSDSNIAISHNISKNRSHFTTFQSSSMPDQPLQNAQLIVDFNMEDATRRQTKGVEPAENSIEKFSDASPSNTGSTKTADLSPKVNHSIPTETSARSNSSSDSRVSFEFSLEAERMVSSLCSSTPIKESHFTEPENTEQLSEPIAHFLRLMCHSEQKNQNRAIGSKEHTDCFNATNAKYNTECSSNLPSNNANATESHSTSKEAFKTPNKETKVPCSSQIPSINESTSRRDPLLAQESKYVKSCCSETFQQTSEEIKRTFNEGIREEETLFKKAALRGCYEISFILSENLSPGFDGIESFRRNVVEIISKADTIFGRRYILRDVVIGFLQLANCWANLYSCIGLPQDELKHGGDLHELFWTWTCASRKLMSGFNNFFEQQACTYTKQKTDKLNLAQEEQRDYYNHKNVDTNKDRIATLASDSGTALSNASERSKKSYMAPPSQSRGSFYYPLNPSTVSRAAVENGSFDATKASPCQHNHLPHWGAKKFTRSSLETASYKTYGNMSKNKRYYYDNSKRSYYAHTPKYICCQDRTTSACAMAKGEELHCVPSCTASLSGDSVIKQEACCQTPFNLTSQQRGGRSTSAEIGFGRQAGNMLQQIQNEHFECNDKEKSNRYSYLSKNNHASTGNYTENRITTPQNIPQCNDLSAMIKNANICASSQMLQDINNSSNQRSKNAECRDIQKAVSLKHNCMSHGDVNENQFICSNNEAHTYNTNPYNSTRNGNVTLPVLQDDPDSSEELEERVYMKPGSYQVPKKKGNCSNTTTAQFWNTKNDTIVSSQAQTGISLPAIQNSQSQLSSISHFLNNQHSEQNANLSQMKNMQNESKVSADLAWKAACESAKTLLEALQRTSTVSTCTSDEQLELSHRENASPICMQKVDTCLVQNLEPEESSQNDKRETQDNKRNSTPTPEKRKSNVRTDDWLIHTLNNLSKPQAEMHKSQDSETSNVTEKEKADVMSGTNATHSQENTKCAESSKHNEHVKTVHHVKQTASKSSSNKRTKDGKNTEERPTPRTRKGASGSSGKKPQYQGAERNSSTSRKRKLQERSPKDDDSMNLNSKENSLRATNNGSNRKNKPDMRNKSSWNVWYSSRRRRGLSQMAVDKLENILNTIWNMEESDFVKYTIDSNKARDYYKCVKHPMFLETIANKLKNRIYETIEHFVHDFRRVFFNAKLYNKDDTFHYKLVKILESKLNFLLDEHFSGWDLGYITGIPTEVANIPALRYLSYVGDGANTSKGRRSKASNKSASSPRKAASTSTAQKQQT